MTLATYGVTIKAMDKTTLYLTPDLRRRLQHASRSSGRRQSDVIRAALDAYLAADQPKLPASIGAGEDGELAGADTEDWLRDRWSGR